MTDTIIKLQCKEVGTKETPYKFEDVKTGKIYDTNIYFKKPFKDSIKEGDFGDGILGAGKDNTYWLNSWTPTRIQEPVHTLQEYKEETNTTNSEVVRLSSNGARAGMIINNAVAIAIAEMNAQNKTQVDLNRVAGVSRALNTMFKED